MFATNVFGLVEVTKRAVPIMRAGGGGVICNVTSSSTLAPVPFLGTYRASKAAVTAIGESLAAEVGRVRDTGGRDHARTDRDGDAGGLRPARGRDRARGVPRARGTDVEEPPGHPRPVHARAEAARRIVDAICDDDGPLRYGCDDMSAGDARGLERHRQRELGRRDAARVLVSTGSVRRPVPARLKTARRPPKPFRALRCRFRSGGGGLSGSPEGFEALFRGEYARLCRALASFGDGAEEAVQEAFVRALARWSRVGAMENAAAWVRTVAVHQLLNARRSRAREDRATARAGRPSEEPSPDATLDVRAVLRDALAAAAGRGRDVLRRRLSDRGGRGVDGTFARRGEVPPPRGSGTAPSTADRGP